MHQHDPRTEAALYWSAVSLIVCEGLSIEKAAITLGVEGEELTSILHRRQSLRLVTSEAWPPRPAARPTEKNPRSQGRARVRVFRSM